MYVDYWPASVSLCGFFCGSLLLCIFRYNPHYNCLGYLLITSNWLTYNSALSIVNLKYYLQRKINNLVMHFRVFSSRKILTGWLVVLKTIFLFSAISLLKRNAGVHWSFRTFSLWPVSIFWNILPIIGSIFKNQITLQIKVDLAKDILC